jgi:hypothetical protein
MTIHPAEIITTAKDAQPIHLPLSTSSIPIIRNTPAQRPDDAAERMLPRTICRAVRGEAIQDHGTSCSEVRVSFFFARSNY